MAEDAAIGTTNALGESHQPDLNPEQALNLTDEDMTKLRSLLIEHVSANTTLTSTACSLHSRLLSCLQT